MYLTLIGISCLIRVLKSLGLILDRQEIWKRFDSNWFDKQNVHRIESGDGVFLMGEPRRERRQKPQRGGAPRKLAKMTYAFDNNNIKYKGKDYAHLKD